MWSVFKFPSRVEIKHLTITDWFFSSQPCWETGKCRCSLRRGSSQLPKQSATDTLDEPGMKPPGSESQPGALQIPAAQVLPARTRSALTTACKSGLAQGLTGTTTERFFTMRCRRPSGWMQFSLSSWQQPVADSAQRSMENRIARLPQNKTELDVKAGREHQDICIFQGHIYIKGETEACFCLFN